MRKVLLSLLFIVGLAVVAKAGNTFGYATIDSTGITHVDLKRTCSEITITKISSEDAYINWTGYDIPFSTASYLMKGTGEKVQAVQSRYMAVSVSSGTPNIRIQIKY